MYKENGPLKSVRENKMFTLETFDQDEIMCDDNGAYKNLKVVKTYYRVQFITTTKIKTQLAHTDGKDFFVKERRSRKYVNVSVPTDEVYLLERTYRDNKNFKGLRHLVVRAKNTIKHERFCCVIYSRSAETIEDDTVLLPHGNSKKNLSSSYIRTSKTILEKEDEMLEMEGRPSMVYDQMVRNANPFTSCSQSQEPRNLKQVYNRKYQKSKEKHNNKVRITYILVKISRKNNFAASKKTSWACYERSHRFKMSVPNHFYLKKGLNIYILFKKLPKDLRVRPTGQ